MAEKEERLARIFQALGYTHQDGLPVQMRPEHKGRELPCDWAPYTLPCLWFRKVERVLEHVSLKGMSQ